MLENDDGLSKERQFLRHCTVTVKNFNKEVKTVIGNEFEIEFEYFKTVDQTQEDDSGKVTIYGLSKSTIALLEEEGGEIWLDCGYENSFVGTLFIAYVSRVYTDVVNNTTATTLECSANLLTHFFSGYAISDGTSPIPLMELLNQLALAAGFPQAVFVYDNIPESDFNSIVKYVNTLKATSYNIGDMNTVLDSLTDYYGLTFGRGLFEGIDSAAFSFTDLGLKKALNNIAKGYQALEITDPETVNAQTQFHKTLVSDERTESGFVLTKETGLISAQAEYQMATSFLDQKLSANERETAESLYKRNNPREKKKKKGSENTNSNVVSSYNNSGDGYVSNTTLEGLVIKGGVGGQATGGGMVRGFTADFSKIVSNLLGTDLIRFTGFNDINHAGSSSSHASGQAFDVTIKSAHAGAPNQKKRILEAAKQHGYRVTVLDEYNDPSPNSTAPHLHVSVYGKDGSQQNNSPTENLAEEGGEDKTIFSVSQEELYGRIPIEINRRYNRITALLNPSVKPQSLIFTKDENYEDYLLHRVRNVKFVGNNKRGDWLMTLYCEDTESKTVSGYKVSTQPTSTELVPE